MATAAAGKFYSAAANSCKGVRKQPRRVLRAGEALRQLHHQGCWRDFVRASAAPSSSGSPPFGPVDVSKLEGYTPYIYISYADRQSRTSARVTVNASADECFAIWYDRANHFKFLTLAEQIGYENDDSKLAMYMLFYRWGTLPALQIMCEIERTEVVPGKLIKFQNHGDVQVESELPLSGEVRFEQEGSSTVVSLEISYGVPNLLVREVGQAAVVNNIKDIILDNLVRFKAAVEG